MPKLGRYPLLPRLFLWNKPRYRALLSTPAHRFSFSRSLSRPAGGTHANWWWSETKNPKTQYQMNKSYKTIITAAAIAGLYLGGLAAKSYGAEAGTTAPAG